MARVPRPEAARRSERLLRLVVNGHPAILDSRLRDRFGWQASETIEWLSPLKDDDYAEYSDGDFLRRLGLEDLKQPLQTFWPDGGPCWDGLGRTARRCLLIEAKAHIDETCSTPSGAVGESREQIGRALDELKAFLGSKSPNDWSTLFYQYANRLAHLYHLRQLNDIDAYLVLVYFCGATDAEAASVEQWEGAIRLLKTTLGIGRRHKLSRYIAEVFIDESELSGAV